MNYNDGAWAMVGLATVYFIVIIFAVIFLECRKCTCCMCESSNGKYAPGHEPTPVDKPSTPKSMADVGQASYPPKYDFYNSAASAPAGGIYPPGDDFTRETAI